MVDIRNEKAQGEVITIDGCNFINCEFTNCNFIYSGGHFQFTKCKFSGSANFQLKDAASRTVDLLNIFSRYILGGTKIPKSIQ